MKNITIDGIQYDLSALPEEARSQLNMLNLADQEIARLTALLAMVKTARAGYGQVLKQLLSEIEGKQSDNEKIIEIRS